MFGPEKIIVLGTPQVIDADQLTQFPEGAILFHFDRVRVTLFHPPSNKRSFLAQAEGTSLTNNLWPGINHHAIFPMSREQAARLVESGGQNPLRRNLLFGELKPQSPDRNPREKTA